MIYETWHFRGRNFDLRYEDEADPEIEEIKQAMIRAGADLIMHRRI